MANLEHINLTVSDPRATALMLCDLFDWKIRWEGEAMDSGYTLHVGNEDTYLAVYATRTPAALATENRHRDIGLNHVGITVSDLQLCEERVTRAGYRAFNHSTYEPCKSFYFLDADNIEFEVISYS